MAWFGNTNNTGTATNAPPANDKAVSKFTPDFDGTLNAITFYTSTGRASGSRAVVYDASGTGGLPGNLIGVTNELATTSAGWSKYTFPSGLSLTVAGGPYWIGIWCGTLVNTPCPTLTNGIAYNANTYSGTGNPSNPFGASPTMANVVYPVTGVYDPSFIAGSPNSWRVYPSTADSTNSASNVPGANAMALSPVASNNMGTVNSISWEMSAAAVGHVKAVIYDASGAGGAPGNLLGTSNEITNPVMGLNTATFASPVTVSGNIYIGLHADVNLPSYAATTTFTGGTNSYTKTGVTYSGGPPSSFGVGTPGSTSINIWASGTFTTGQSLALAATDLVDHAAFGATVTTVSTLTLAATDPADHAAFAATVRNILQLALAATEAPDHAAFSSTVTVGIVNAALAARDATDTAHFATLKVGYDLSQVWVTLLAPHDFSAVYWLTNDVLSPQTYVPPDFTFTPLMRGENAYSAQQIAALEARTDPFALKEFFAMSKVITYNYANPQVH